MLLYLPAEGEGSLPPGVDKVVHAGMFGGPTLLALVAGWRFVPILLAAYAPVTEIIQGLPAIGRDPDWRDILADAVGVLAATALAAFWRRRRNA